MLSHHHSITKKLLKFIEWITIMAFFHKTLAEAKEAIEKGNYVLAKLIIDSHLKDCYKGIPTLKVDLTSSPALKGGDSREELWRHGSRDVVHTLLLFLA